MGVTSNNIITKQPSEIIGCSMDFTNWLTAGDTLVSHAITIDLSGLTIASGSIDGNFVKMVASGGISGYTYRVNVSVGTSFGYTYEGDGLLKIRDR